jgi:hypothetical protein
MPLGLPASFHYPADNSIAVVSADGFLNTLLMIVLFVLPAWTAIARWFTPRSEARQAAVSEPDGQSQRPWWLEDATAAITMSVSILAFSAWTSPKLQTAFDLNFRRNLIVTTLVMLTAGEPASRVVPALLQLRIPDRGAVSLSVHCRDRRERRSGATAERRARGAAVRHDSHRRAHRAVAGTFVALAVAAVLR